MTALSLNLTPAKPLDASGIALEGLPPLEAGRSLPAAFAEALKKLTDEAREPAAAEGEGAATPASGEPLAKLEEGSAEAPLPGARSPVEQLPPTRQTGGSTADSPRTDATPTTASGKPLPVGRTDLAAAQGEGVQSARSSANMVQADAPTGTAQNPVAGAARQGRVAKISPDEAKPDRGIATPVQGFAADPTTPIQPVSRADARTLSEPVTADAAGPAQTPAQTPAQGGPATPVGQATLAASAPMFVAAPPIAPATAPRTMAGGAAANLDKTAATGTPAIAPLATSPAQAPIAQTAGAQSDGAGHQQQNSAAGEQARRGEGETMLASRQATREVNNTPAPSPAPAPAPAPAAQQVRHEAQTGLSLQLRAADRPMTVTETGLSLSPGSTLSSSASPIAAPTFGPVTANATLGVAAPAGQMPHFPELAAMVDRIAAARDSAGGTGSASATIALAHKELGNLSLTFETTGRVLDVEVAAQDGETQRALAAAIAADRPQLRAGEAQAQPNTQSANQAGAQSGQANAQGTGAGSADQSGPANGGAGDSRQERRDRRGDGDRSHPGSDAHGHRQPKSDGGIYA